jgi:hypothetical protein
VALHVGGVEDVAQLVAGEAVGASVEGIELGAKPRAAVLVPCEGADRCSPDRARTAPWNSWCT